MPIRLLAAVALLCFASCLLPAQDLQMQVPSTQGAIVGQKLVLPLTVTGGVQPYTWHLVNGDLPPGCQLHKHAGNIACVPATPGDYRFTISVTDSNIPHAQIQREITIHVIAGLTIDWKEPPKVNGNAISGSAVVSNQTGQDVDLTVVVVAVNEVGRATALGYQHFTLSAQTASPLIPFASSPGPGTYYVRADAVAHRPGHHHAYRASKQTDPMKLTQF